MLLICISFMTNDVRHPFMCFLAVRMSSSAKYLFRSFAHFLTGSFVFLLLSSESSLYILAPVALWDM